MQYVHFRSGERANYTVHSIFVHQLSFRYVFFFFSLSPDWNYTKFAKCHLLNTELHRNGAWSPLWDRLQPDSNLIWTAVWGNYLNSPPQRGCPVMGPFCRALQREICQPICWPKKWDCQEVWRNLWAARSIGGTRPGEHWECLYMIFPWVISKSLIGWTVEDDVNAGLWL